MRPEERIQAWLDETRGQYRTQMKDETPTTMQEMMRVMTKDRMQVLEAVLVLLKPDTPKAKHTCPVCGNEVDTRVTSEDLEDAHSEDFFAGGR